jgi:hypothetical protein
MMFFLCCLLQKSKAPETFVEAALRGRRDALRDPAARCAMGLPIQSGTGGQFTLLSNPRMARRGVPQEHLAEPSLSRTSASEADRARGDHPQEEMAAWTPPIGEEPGGDGWTDDAIEQASTLRFQILQRLAR